MVFLAFIFALAGAAIGVQQSADSAKVHYHPGLRDALEKVAAKPQKKCRNSARLTPVRCQSQAGAK